MKAEIIAVGSELLTPYRLDTNSLYLTGELNKLGIRVVHKAVVGDAHGLNTRKYQPASRGGRGHAVQKRTALVRVLPPPIELVDWDKRDDNGQASLF